MWTTLADFPRLLAMRTASSLSFQSPAQSSGHFSVFLFDLSKAFNSWLLSLLFHLFSSQASPWSPFTALFCCLVHECYCCAFLSQHCHSCSSTYHLCADDVCILSSHLFPKRQTCASHQLLDVLSECNTSTSNSTCPVLNSFLQTNISSSGSEWYPIQAKNPSHSLPPF